MFLNDRDSETSQKRQDKLRDKTSDSAEQGAGERSLEKDSAFPGALPKKRKHRETDDDKSSRPRKFRNQSHSRRRGFDGF